MTRIGNITQPPVNLILGFGTHYTKQLNMTSMPKVYYETLQKLEELVGDDLPSLLTILICSAREIGLPEEQIEIYQGLTNIKTIKRLCIRYELQLRDKE